MRRDFHYAWRLLRRSPGFTATALVTLAIGIGANTAVFSVLEAVLIRPPAYHDPDRLVVLQRYYERKNQTVEQVSVPDWKDWTERNRTLADLAVYTPDTVTMTGGGSEAQRIEAAGISANLPGILGISPLLGRSFGKEDEQPGAPPVVLLSERMWRERFAANRSILGQTLTIQETPIQIVGVMPASFAFPNPSTALWLPQRFQPREFQRRNVFYLHTIGRLKAGVSLAMARADLSSVAAAVAREHPDTNTGQGVAVTTLREYSAGTYRTLLLVRREQ